MRKICTSLALLLFLCGAVEAQERLNRIMFNKSIRIGVSGNQPPFSMVSNKDQLIGFEIDLGNRLASALGIEVEYVQLPFPELLPALQENKVDIILSGMTMTTQRNLSVAFAGPYISTGKSLLTKNSKYASIADVSELDSRKLKVGTLKGSTSEEFVKNFLSTATLVAVDDYEKAIDMVRSGEIDIMVADYAECLYASLKYSADNLQVLNQTLTNERIGIALPPDDPLMMNLLENFLGELLESGELGTLEAKWFQSGAWMMEVK